MPKQRNNWKLIVDGTLRGRNVFAHENFYPLYEKIRKRIKVTNNHYPLFWIKKGEHKATVSSEALASLIQQASDAAKPVSMAKARLLSNKRWKHSNPALR